MDYALKERENQEFFKKQIKEDTIDQKSEISDKNIQIEMNFD